MSRLCVCVCLVVLTTAVVASADLGAVTWSGGTLRLLDDHPTISLTSEKLLFEPQFDTTLVTASFEFENKGDACEAQMGFPALEYNRGPGSHYVRHFVVDADGEALDVAEQDGTIQLGERERECKWYLLTVPFEAGQTRRLRVRYDEFRMYSGGDIVRVPYVLATGATWNGAIRDLDIEVRLGERLNYHDIELLGDKQPLEVRWEADTLYCRLSEYDGEPEMLFLNAGVGPTSVTRDDGRRHDGGWCVRWRRGILLVALDYLCDVLLAEATWSDAHSAKLGKEGNEVQLRGWTLPTGTHRGATLFVQPGPALEAFGGAIEVTRDDAGDAQVAISACPDSAQSARDTALHYGQETEHRLRCLRALGERWPDELGPVCEEIAARSREQAPLLAWVFAYLTEVSPGSVDAKEIRTRLGAGGNWVDELTETALATRDDRIVRGGAMALAEAAPLQVRAALIHRISNCDNWQHGVHRGRNAGLVLRLLKTPEAASALTDAVRSHEWHQPSEDAMVALGFLGDESAIEFLHDTALEPEGKSRDIICRAAQSLSYIGTPAALEACADVWLNSDDGEVRWRALLGIRIAVGAKTYRSSYMPALHPEWARPMSLEEGCRVSLPLLERLLPRARELDRENDVASVIETAREKLAAFAAAGGG